MQCLQWGEAGDLTSHQSLSVHGILLWVIPLIFIVISFFQPLLSFIFEISAMFRVLFCLNFIKESISLERKMICHIINVAKGIVEIRNQVFWFQFFSLPTVLLIYRHQLKAITWDISKRNKLYSYKWHEELLSSLHSCISCIGPLCSSDANKYLSSTLWVQGNLKVYINFTCLKLFKFFLLLKWEIQTKPGFHYF